MEHRSVVGSFREAKCAGRTGCNETSGWTDYSGDGVAPATRPRFSIPDRRSVAVLRSAQSAEKRWRY